MNQNDKIENISKEIIKPSLNLGVDYTEVGLDEIFEDGILKEIPIVKTLVTIVKTGVAIKERFFVKKFLVFLQEFHSGDISFDVLNKFRKKFERDKKYRKKITEQILILVEELDSIKKSKILAHLFSTHIESHFTWGRFVTISNCLKKIHEASFEFLKALSKTEYFAINSGKTTVEVIKNLKRENKHFDSNGIAEERALLMVSGIVYQDGTLFSITKIGQDLYNHGISKILKNG